MYSNFCYVIFAGMMGTLALIIWKGLMCITGIESYVVLSGSMEPGFKRLRGEFSLPSSYPGRHMPLPRLKPGTFGKIWVSVANWATTVGSFLLKWLKMFWQFQSQPVTLLSDNNNNGNLLGDFQSSMSPSMAELLVCTQDWINHSEKQIKVQDASTELGNIMKGSFCNYIQY
ncbi:putative signal peptidase I [Helianthus anomalus]